MTSRSISLYLLILMSAFSAFAFDGDRRDTTFSLSNSRIYYPGDQDIVVQLSGRLDRRTELKMHAYRINDPTKFFRSLENPHNPSEGIKEGVDPRRSSDYTFLHEWEFTPASRRRDYVYETIPLPMNDKGVYLITASAAGKVANTVVVITELGMVVKQSPSEILAFVVDRHSGARVTGIPIAFGRPGGPESTVKTDDGGVARMQTSQIKTSDTGGTDAERFRGGEHVVAMGSQSGNFVISDSYFYDYYGSQGSIQTYMHTDRPVYRPSQTVYYRAIVRRALPEGGWANVTDSIVSVEVADSRGNVFARDTLRLSDLGTFSDSIQLAEEPPLGTYNIRATVDGSVHNGTFQVEEYKKPEYEVTVTTEQPSYVVGDKIRGKIKAAYYFGSPVTNATVSYEVTRTRYWRPWWSGTEWAWLYEMDTEDRWGYYNRETEVVATGEGKLGEDGTLAFDVETKAETEGVDYSYRIEAHVTDASRRSIAGSASVTVARGEYYVQVRTDRYVYSPNQEATAIVTATTFDGETKVAVPFGVKVLRYWWDGRRGNGEQKQEEVWSGQGETGSDGEGRVSFRTGKAGYYTVLVTVRDSRGNEITASSSIYVAERGAHAWWHNANSGTQIIPDRDVYKPGDTMTALVILPGDAADALITAEGATIYSHHVERMGGSGAIVRIPITEQHAPNIFLAVSAISNDQFLQATERIIVTPEEKILTLEVKPDREVYRPGDHGTVTIRALDSKGQPVANVDVALSMVDEAVYAVSPDRTQPIKAFFYGNRWNKVSTTTSLSFYFYGESRTMSTTDSASENALGFSPDRPASLKGSALMARSDDEALVQPVIRKDFKDLMFWDPSIRTDASGVARVQVTFPDNLTTWRMTARGVTAATMVGETRATVIARKDLLVRMETPRFITQGDSLLIATTVHNYLPSEQNIKVVFDAKGARVTDTERRITIPANGEQRVDWPITAAEVGEAILTVKALTTTESDAMELRVPILPRGVRTGASEIADIDGDRASRTITMSIPEASEPSTRSLTVNLSPSAASSILGSLPDLIGYPYGCVEQTMSRFLPTVVVADVLKNLDVPFDPKLRAEIPKMAAQGLKHLYELQHEDGGWGWWTHDETNPFMTAYVLYGMAVAQRDGYAVDDVRYDRGKRMLESLIEKGSGREGRGGELTTEAYMLYVSSVIHGSDVSDDTRRRTRTLADEDEINNYALSLLTLAAHLQKDAKLAERYADRLVYAAKPATNGVSWPGRSWHYNWQDDEVETSASAVKALIAVRPNDPLIQKGVRWLLGQKTGSSWNSTRQTAMVVYALTDYIAMTNELNPDYVVTVSVNGHEILSQHITRADVFSPEISVQVDRSILRTGGNDVVIEKKGEGMLYASLRTDYYATGNDLRAASSGFTVTREYFLLEPKKTKDGFIYTKRSYNGSIMSGQEILVKVTVKPERPSEYVMVEDPLPAGCEVVTDTRSFVIQGENSYSQNNGYYGRRPWIWWYADRDVRDEKVSFFARQMESSKHEFTYILRAQIPGVYSVMPTVGSLMYYPEVRGNSGTLAMTITDR